MKNLIGGNDTSGCVRGVHNKESYWDHAPVPTQEKLFPDYFGDVYLFHNKFGAHIGLEPKVPKVEVVELRKTLIEEEYKEVQDAIQSQNLSEIAKELCDLIYVVCGTAVSYGIDLNSVWDLVHASNMAKEKGGNRSDGKILKPEGWRKPDITLEIKRQQGL